MLKMFVIYSSGFITLRVTVKVKVGEMTNRENGLMYQLEILCNWFLIDNELLFNFPFSESHTHLSGLRERGISFCQVQGHVI